MKKIKNVIKKIFPMIIIFVTFLYTKVFGAGDMLLQPMYGVQMPTPEPQQNIIIKLLALIRNLSILLIPIVFIIGVIMHFKKSQGKHLKKLNIILIVLILIALGITGIMFLL